jgi:DNA gyrase inhibitor
MNILFEEMPAYRIAFMREIGPYGAANSQAMEDLKEWARCSHLFDDNSIILGIAQDDPESTSPEDCRYDTCIVVPEDFSLNDSPVMEGVITGGRYAIFTIDHTAEAIKKMWAAIFPELLNQGYEVDRSRPIIERYRLQMINNHLCEICVPVCG